MAGVTVKVEDSELQRKVAALQSGLADATPLMENWGQIALESILHNFDVGGRPAWQPLSPVTVRLKAKRGGSAPDRLLFFKGFLRAGISYRAESNRVVLGTSPNTSKYAAIQNFGGTINHPGGTPYFIDKETGMAKFVKKADGGKLPKTKPHAITIPARPYMVLQQEDVDEMTVAARQYLTELAV